MIYNNEDLELFEEFVKEEKEISHMRDSRMELLAFLQFRETQKMNENLTAAQSSISILTDEIRTLNSHLDNVNHHLLFWRNRQ